MYQAQKGFWPTLTLLLGLLMTGFFFLTLVSFLFTAIDSSVQMASMGLFVPGSLVRYLAFFLFYLFLMFFGYILMAFFPAVRLIPGGLEYRTLFFRRQVAWEDMVSLEDARWPKGTKALVFIRKRKNVLRYLFDNSIRLYPNQTHGRMAGVHEPVILLTASLPNREEILAEIQKRLPAPRREGTETA